MWIMMIVTIGLAWWVPFEVTCKSLAWDITVPSVIAVGIFWGIYACIDVILYIPALMRDVVCFLRNVMHSRTKKALENKKLKTSLLAFNGQTEALMQMAEHIEPHNADEALLYSIVFSMSMDLRLISRVRRWADTWLTHDAVQYTTLMYERMGHPHASCISAAPIFFIGRMPVWLEQWSQRIIPPLTVLAECILPHSVVHSSWYPWMKRVVIAKILTEHTVEGIKKIIQNIPQDCVQDRLVQWALLERLYFLDMADRIDFLGDIYQKEDDLVALYAWLYSGEKAILLQWRDVEKRLNNVLNKYIDHVVLTQKVTDYFATLSQFDNDAQHIAHRVVYTAQCTVSQALWHAVGLQIQDKEEN